MAKKKINGMAALEPLAVMAAGGVAGAVIGTALNGVLSPEAGYGTLKNGVIDMETAENKALPILQTPLGVMLVKVAAGAALLYAASETTAETQQALAGVGIGLAAQGASQYIVQVTNQGGTEAGMWTNQGKISGARYGVGCGCSSKLQGIYTPAQYYFDDRAPITNPITEPTNTL